MSFLCCLVIRVYTCLETNFPFWLVITMSKVYMCFETILPCSRVITLITTVPYIWMHRVYMSFEISFPVCLVITLITTVPHTSMHTVYMSFEMCFLCCLVVTQITSVQKCQKCHSCSDKTQRRLLSYYKNVRVVPTRPLCCGACPQSTEMSEPFWPIYILCGQGLFFKRDCEVASMVSSELDVVQWTRQPLMLLYFLIYI